MFPGTEHYKSSISKNLLFKVQSGRSEHWQKQKQVQGVKYSKGNGQNDPQIYAFHSFSLIQIMHNKTFLFLTMNVMLTNTVS